MADNAIHISDATLKKLSTLRQSEEDSYDAVISRLLNDVEEDVLSPSDIADIKKGLDDIKRGRTQTEEALLIEFGVDA
ncbi:MAG: hypothetical protein AB1656_21430 [Candidatus Omnitrophota bacterium]